MKTNNITNADIVNSLHPSLEFTGDIIKHKRGKSYVCKCKYCHKLRYKRFNRLGMSCKCDAKRGLVKRIGFMPMYLIDNIIKHRITRNKIEFNISPEYCFCIFLEQCGKCKLCNDNLYFPIKTSAPYIYKTNSSLDRIDSKKGYVIDNIQWLCKMCQIMKNAFDQTLFIQQCQKIISNTV